MRSWWWRAFLPGLYVAWAFYLLNIPDMPNLHASDMGFLSLWAFRSLNFIGGLLSIAVVQICWHTHVWFFSPGFQQLSSSGFAALVAVILLTGVLQWWGVGWFVARFYRGIREPGPPRSK